VQKSVQKVCKNDLDDGIDDALAAKVDLLAADGDGLVLQPHAICQNRPKNCEQRWIACELAAFPEKELPSQ